MLIVGVPLQMRALYKRAKGGAVDHLAPVGLGRQS